MSGEFLLSMGTNPVIIAVMIFGASFLLEDVASVGAALLSSMGLISIPLAVSSLMLGIFIGDLGLYGLGRLARTHSWARTYIGEARSARGQLWLQNRLLATLLAARFVPGARLPIYTASGFLEVPFALFATITAGASIVWTAVIFIAVAWLGAGVAELATPWKWLIGGALLLAAAFAPRILRLLNE